MNRKQFLKSAGVLTLALIFSCTMGGCGRRDSGSSSIDQSVDYTVEEIDVEEGQESFDAYLSYANFKYIENGDGEVDFAIDEEAADEDSEMNNADRESAPSSGKTEKMIRKIKKNITIEGNEKKMKVEAVIDALKKAPKKEKNAETFVTEQFTINFIRLVNGNIVIDLSSEGLDDTNMYEEEFFVYQVTDSILNTFDDIKGVRFTVDSEETKELNYIDISGVFTREDVIEFISGEDSNSSKLEAQPQDVEESDENEDSSAENKKEEAGDTDTEKNKTSAATDAKNNNTSAAKNDASNAKNNTSSATQKNNNSGTSSTTQKNNNSGTSSTTQKKNNSTSQNANSGGSSTSTPAKAPSTSGSGSISNSKNNNTSGNGGSSGGSTSGGSTAGTGGGGSTSGGSTSGGSTAGTGGGGSTSGGSTSGGTSGGGSSSGGGGQEGVVNDADV